LDRISSWRFELVKVQKSEKGHWLRRWFCVDPRHTHVHLNFKASSKLCLWDQIVMQTTWVSRKTTYFIYIY
jgi:hypothetical protein